MNSYENRIKNIENKLDKNVIQAFKSKIIDKINETAKKTCELKDLKDNVRILERKIMLLKSELAKYESASAKNSDMFTKLNNQRNKLNKELVEEEIRNEEMEDELENLKNIIVEGKKTLNTIKYNLHDKIYLELMKGLGFVVEKNGEAYNLKVVNKVNKEVYNVQDEKENVWKLIE